MEHIAFYLDKDPLEVKMVNLIKTGDPIYSVPGFTFDGTNFIPRMVDEIKKSGDYEDRKKFIENFNQVGLQN
jgi:xanthine dehydrogenase molybdopterin-binding subunit B